MLLVLTLTETTREWVNEAVTCPDLLSCSNLNCHVPLSTGRWCLKNTTGPYHA